MFLRNAWYVAAWEDDISDGLLPVELLGDRIVLFRKSDGNYAALEDACPHRKLPLSMGRLKDDLVECGYHGLTFDCVGKCVLSPSSHAIPAGAQVRAYPAHARYGLVWLWTGDANLADPSAIIDISEFESAAWGISRGKAMTVDCNYLYLVDNLLDPSHVAWVHQSSFGDGSSQNAPLKTVSNDSGVTVSRWIRDVDPAPFYAPFLQFHGRCDRKQQYEVRYPSNAVIRAIFTPSGTGGDDRMPDEREFLMDSYNFLTPVNERQTRYFWFQLRNFGPGDDAISLQFATGVRDAFEEDRIILNAVQKGMDEKQSPNIDLKIDLGAFRFRRGLAARIDQEKLQVATRG